MLTARTWQTPSGAQELALATPGHHASRLLVLPALFDEANKLRHFTVQTMRLLGQRGVDCLLPDFRGMNESIQLIQSANLTVWREEAEALAGDYAATHVLALRGGVLIAPPGLPLLALAPVAGASLLRALLRARVLSDREAGVATSREELLDTGRRQGLTLSGHTLSADMIGELETSDLPSVMREIGPGELGGPGLWLRAEPDHDQAQAEALAQQLAEWIG